MSRVVMPGTDESLATAALRLLKGPCHLPRRNSDPTTCPFPSLQWIQSPRWTLLLLLLHRYRYLRIGDYFPFAILLLEHV